MNEPVSGTSTLGPVQVERWPTEIPLLVLVALAATGLWFFIIFSIIGLVYAVMIGLLLFFSHLGFIAYLRGSAVRLGPDQFPDLHRRVEELSARAGLTKVPEAYIMQAGGSLNALATHFLGSRMIVLFTDLLEACGDNAAARDMIIGHELGHIKAGHLRFRWFLFPGFLVPFLGMAYSRAREYTCDRYGAALCGDQLSALVGLGILAAGGSHGRQVNLEALARQRDLLNTGWMTLGKWFSTHPPLSERIAALEPRFLSGAGAPAQGPVRALGILAILILLPIAGLAVALSTFLPDFQQALAEARTQAAAMDAQPLSIVADAVTEKVWTDLDNLAMVAESVKRQTGSLPEDEAVLYTAWDEAATGEEAPLDPFDGQRYGYMLDEGHFILWSAGPDGEGGTDDDIWYDSRMRGDE